MNNKYLTFRKFDNKFMVLDKLRKDIYFLEKKVYEVLQEGDYKSIDDPNEFLTHILNYYTNTPEIDEKSIRSTDYTTLDKALYNFKVPISCTIEITNTCNLKCMHCYHGSSLNHKIEILDISDLENIFSQLYELGTIVITLTGGEFFLRNDYVQILNCLSKYDFLIQIFSNGILLGKEERKVLDMYGVDLVQISLYGTDEFETELRLNKKFEKAYENLIDSKQNNFTSAVVLTPYLSNYPFIQSVSRKLKKENIKYSFNIGLFPSRDFSTDNLKQSVDYDKAYLEKLSKIGEVLKPKKRKSINIRPCNAGRTIIHIDYNGNVSPCIAWPEYVGNIKECPISNMYNSEKMQNIRSIKISDIIKCRTCDHVLNCNICLGANYLYSMNCMAPNDMLCYHSSILRSL
ncbi:MAG: radical SAM protein [Ignavibacteriales bacterium]|nr:radical SAM protein [Ignavibacteriales bacterium]